MTALTDDTLDVIDESPEEAREWLMRMVRTQGARVAYKAAMDILADPRSPAPAKATTLTAVFRVGGFLDRKDESADVEPHNMSAEQMNREIARLEKRRTKLNDGSTSDDPGGAPGDGVFG